MNPEKQSVRDFWNAAPCGTAGVQKRDDLRAFLQEIERRRYELEPFIAQYADFDRWKGRRTLEVGCGTGTDLLQFLRAGAVAQAIDLSSQSAALARARLRFAGFEGSRVVLSDAENLPFPDNHFDLVYSWGVLHHTPDTARAINEVHRVLRPNGEICIMLYHRWSLVSLQFYLRFGLLRARPFRNLDDIMANHQESPGTKVYTRTQLKHLFDKFQNLRIQPVLTPYDLQYSRRGFLPQWIRRFVPNSLGYFLVVRGQKCG
jgi:ubiquinone/menaquinone biosynthesis C-methylase UbiE